MQICHRFVLATAAAAALTACSHSPHDPLGPTVYAQVQLQPTQGQQVQGEVRMSSQKDGSIRVQGQVQGLKANGVHGFHVHEKGDCSAPDAASAGGHFNPHGAAHGRFGSGHAGDLPSLRSDAAGVARFDFSTRNFTLGYGPANAMGRALVVHQDADDYTSQPAGNAGARVACGVLRPGA